MQKIASAFAALAVLAPLTAPAYSRTTLADFRSGGVASSQLSEYLQKQKKVKIVDKPGDASGGTNSSADTPTSPKSTPPVITIERR